LNALFERLEIRLLHRTPSLSQEGKNVIEQRSKIKIAYRKNNFAPVRPSLKLCFGFPASEIDQMLLSCTAGAPRRKFSTLQAGRASNEEYNRDRM